MSKSVKGSPNLAHQSERSVRVALLLKAKHVLKSFYSGNLAIYFRDALAKPNGIAHAC
jgi:hypothetical protein